MSDFRAELEKILVGAYAGMYIDWIVRVHEEHVSALRQEVEHTQYQYDEMQALLNAQIVALSEANAKLRAGLEKIRSNNQTGSAEDWHFATQALLAAAATPEEPR